MRWFKTGGSNVSSGFLIFESKWDKMRRYLYKGEWSCSHLWAHGTYDGAAAWCASSTMRAFMYSALNFSSRCERSSVWKVATVLYQQRSIIMFDI